MSKSKPVNFRLSKESRELLEAAAVASGKTKTQIVELCVMRHALSIPKLAEAARAALSRIVLDLLAGDAPESRPPG